MKEDLKQTVNTDIRLFNSQVNTVDLIKEIINDQVRIR